MIWVTLALIAISIAVSLLSFFLTPKPEIEDARPNSLGDFEFPTATEKRAIPVVWGSTKIAGPNVIWYGDFSSERIRQTENGEKLTIGFKYRMGMDMAIAHGDSDMEIYRVDIGDKEDVFDGVIMNGVSTFNIFKPELFGGREKGGGVVGTLEFYEGTNTAGVGEVSQYMADQVAGGVADEMPAYPNVCHAVWRGSSATGPDGRPAGYMTTRSTIEKWTFYARRYPLPAAMTIDPGAEQIGDDANPICVLFETLTDSVWGLGLPVTEIDIPSFNAAANTVAAEGFGFSMVWTSIKPVRELVAEVARTVDASVFQTADGKLEIVLARVEASPITLDETNVVELREFTRNAWNQTSNDVQIDFVDRTDNFKSTSAAEQDLANFRLQGAVNVVATQNYPGVKDPTVASQLASRELRQLSFPLARIELEVNRDASFLKPGNTFVFNWPELGISNMVVRVTSVGLGELRDGGVLINGIEDVFGIGNVIFSAPPQSDWVPVLIEPTDIAIRDIIQVGQQFADGADEFTGDTLDVDFRYVALAKNPGNGFEYTAWSRIDGTADPFLPWDPAEFPNSASTGPQYLGYTPTASNAAVLLGYAGGSEILTSLTLGGLSSDFRELMELDDFDVSPLGVRTFTTQEVRDGKALIFLTDGARSEYLGFETLTDNFDGTVTLGTVYRGLLDTTPWTWAVGTTFWFLGEQYVVETDAAENPTLIRSTRRVGPALAVAAVEDIRLAQETTGGLLFPEQAVEINRTVPTQPRQTRPCSVGEVDIRLATAAGGAGLGAATPQYTPDSNVLVAGATRNQIPGFQASIDMRVTWSNRERVRQAGNGYWLPTIDGNEPPQNPEITADPTDPFVTGGAGVTPFRRATVTVNGVGVGGPTLLGTQTVDISLVNSVDFLALPISTVSNSDFLEVRIFVQRVESGGTIYGDTSDYYAVFERTP